MTWPERITATIQNLKRVQRDLQEVFTDRQRAVELLVLATVCQEHLLFLGPPGTAKTQLITSYTEQLDLAGFTYLLTRFSEPAELFGPLDLAAFQRGEYHVRTEGMLPAAQVVFLDEIFQGSSAILNALLTILNERTFHNGPVRQQVPLVTLIGATNVLPQDPSLLAFADRFTLRIEVNRVADEHLEELLQTGWQFELARIRAAAAQLRGQPTPRPFAKIRHEEVLGLHERLAEVDLSAIRGEFVQIIREMRTDGIDLSDRRAVRSLKLISGASLLRGGEVAEVQDLWPLQYIWNSPEEADQIQALLVKHLGEDNERLSRQKRPLQDILFDLQTVREQTPQLRTEAQLGALLATLAKLRREIINDYPRENEARTFADEAVNEALGKIGSAGM